MTSDDTTTLPDDASATPSGEPADAARTPTLRGGRGGAMRRRSLASWVIPVGAGAAIAAIAAIVWYVVVVLPLARQVDAAKQEYAVGRYAAAEATLEKVLARDPRHVGALLEMARVKGAAGDSKASLRLYQQVIDAGGGTAEVFYEMALLERVTGDSPAAAEHFRSAWERDRGNLSYLDELAKTLVQLGRGAEAADLYLGVADDGSRDEALRKDYFIRAALAFKQAGKVAEAKAALRQALALAPKDPQATLLLKQLK